MVLAKNTHDDAGMRHASRGEVAQRKEKPVSDRLLLISLHLLDAETMEGCWWMLASYFAAMDWPT